MNLNESYAELVIRIARPVGEGAYEVELSFDRTDQPTIPQPAYGRADFDFSALPDPQTEAQAYGQALRDALFADPALSTQYAVCLATVQQDNLGLRVRLAIDRSASELQALKWETLQRPQAGGPLAIDQNTPFSRFLYSPDWSGIDLRPQGELRALLVVSNPLELQSNPAGYALNTHKELQENRLVTVTRSLSPVNVEAELGRVQPELQKLAAIETLESRKEAGGRPSLENIRQKLDEGWDILYLVCHGALLASDFNNPHSKRKPILVLEDADGHLKRVDGEELASAIRNLPGERRPRLAVLVSCQSAGDEAPPSSTDQGALASLGPMLVEAGIPAVVAMQGDARMDSMAKFIPAFFNQLRQDGQVDRAVAAARQEILSQEDWWVPVLYQRLKSGRIWYIPGFGEGSGDFEKWRSLKTFVQRKKCTPIIGPGLAEPWLGQQSEIALQWARENGYPFAPNDRENLPRIAQYVVRRDGPEFLSMAFQEAMRGEILHHYADFLPPELRQKEAWNENDILAALACSAERRWEINPNEAHRQLAGLGLPIYITTSPGNLLALALAKAGADPQTRICPWWSDQIPVETYAYEGRPTEKQPLVYHLFGHISVPDSLVLSEDNYFDFLIGVTRNKALIPESIRNALTSTALLFLGFRTDEWSFRVLFRTLMAQPGSEQLKRFSHVAAQIEPEEDRLLDSRRARRHLENYFESEKISIYWGRPDEFLNTLSQHMRESS